MMKNYRYFIHLAYNGYHYSGWQLQPNAVTVQQWVENGLRSIAKLTDGITGCGRTDAGVHAADFYAHFDMQKQLDAKQLQLLATRLNRFLPHDIVIYDILPVHWEAHARFSAVSRKYAYKVITQKDPFLYEKAFFALGPFDVEAMNKCAQLLIGKHDFQCFSKVHTEVNNFICDVSTARWDVNGHEMTFTIKADRFLRNMVRAIVGTLLDVGRGKLDEDGFKKVLQSGDRRKAGYSVPARGLTLVEVKYPEDVFGGD